MRTRPLSVYIVHNPEYNKHSKREVFNVDPSTLSNIVLAPSTFIRVFTISKM